ncbi:YbhB/YbcL family Raf kinase inhibitor-like protein [Candidatus Berkelbacteria bacterium]|nr:YbhB/YbcL family Raf kinase inhibitor-like protein [Candidatus Berkelbacteria bacterium]
MKLTSPAFEQSGAIPTRYTCQGGDVSPPLAIADVPDGTKSLALIVDDPDAPVGLWVHWLVWNLDPTLTEIPAGTVPRGGVEGTTSAKTTGYHGPCPPDREHRYYFKVFALDTLLELPPSTAKADLEAAMEGHIVNHAELMGRYEQT